MRNALLLLALPLWHCASPQRPAPAAPAPRPAETADAASADASVEASAPTGAARMRPPPAVGCASEPLVPDFAEQGSALEGLGARASEGVERAEGYLRFRVPQGWTAVRSENPAYSVWHLHTGDAEDVADLLVGNQLPFALHDGDAFRLRVGPILLRGSRWSEHGRHHLDALAMLPCATPRFAQLSMHTSTEARLDAMVAVLRSLALAPEPRTDGREQPLDAARDGAALDALTAEDPSARALLRAALATNSLRATAPLTAASPADELRLEGSLVRRVGALEVRVWLRVPVREGRARMPLPLRGVDSPAFGAALAELTSAGCARPRVAVASDGLSLGCEREPEVHLVLASPDAAEDAFPAALRRWLAARALLARWRRQGARVYPWPASLCDSARLRVGVSADALRITGERCALALEPTGSAILAAAFTGDCAQLPEEPWARALRNAVHLEELLGTGGASSCRWTLGAQGPQAWLVAAGDNGSALEPVQGAAARAVDRRALVTALEFARDVQASLVEPAARVPPQAEESVLGPLGVYRSGGATATALLRALYLGGALADDDSLRPGPGATAVLSVRSPDPEHVELRTLALSLSLARDPQGRWHVTAATPTRWP